jgi:putative ABC transport system permease protein
MSLNTRPILSALWRNRTGAVLVAMQIAIALAVLVNALYIVVQRIEKMRLPTGIDVDNVLVISSAGFTGRYDPLDSIAEDLRFLRGLPGVVAATATSGIPLSGGGSASTLLRRPDEHSSEVMNYFEVDEQALPALGLKLVAGRGFRHEEVQPPLTKADASRFVPSIIVTRALADYLFPGQDPLGKPVYDNLGQTATVIGVVDPMIGSWPGMVAHPDWVYLMPRSPFTEGGGPLIYLVHTQPGQRDAVLKLAEAHLSASNPNRVVHFVRPLNYFRDLTYLGDRSMNIYLGTVTALLIAVTCLGIFALATFNVSTRTKQIGTRRAVGARRRDIVRYFLIENGMITSAGIIGGCALALGVGYWLSLEYSLPRLNLYYLVGGVLALWGVGQLAAWQPARRAAAVSPSVATRTV